MRRVHIILCFHCAAPSKAIPHLVARKETTYKRLALTSCACTANQLHPANLSQLVWWIPQTYQKDTLHPWGDLWALNNSVKDTTPAADLWTCPCLITASCHHHFMAVSLIYGQLFKELFSPTANTGHSSRQKFGSRQTPVWLQHLKTHLPSSIWRAFSLSEELALQSTLTALILICCISHAKKLSGTEMHSDISKPQR